MKKINKMGFLERTYNGRKNKKAQFFLIATIILAAILAALAVASNYLTKTDSSVVDKIQRELRIEAEKVLDYEALHSGNGFDEFDDFSKKYSYYVGQDKDIYFILVDKDNGIEEAYQYAGETKVDLSDDLIVSADDIQFVLDGKYYGFELEKGENFYFIIVYDTGGERYVSTG
jgi:hypothetical protein